MICFENVSRTPQIPLTYPGGTGTPGWEPLLYREFQYIIEVHISGIVCLGLHYIYCTKNSYEIHLWGRQHIFVAYKEMMYRLVA